MAVSEKTIETLIDAVRRVSSSLDLEAVLDTIFDSLRDLIGYSAAVVCVVESRTGLLYDIKARGYPPGTIDQNFFESGSGIIGWVLKHGRGQIVNDVKSDTRYVKARPETASEIASPLIRADGKVIGVINLESDQVNRFDKRDLQLLNMFASLAASAVDHTMLYREVVRQRRVESELDLARKVVDSLLPRHFPLIEGLEIHGTTIPVREVGGDYFDYIDAISDRLAVLVADVSGKGLAAALIMVTFRAYMHATVINELAMRVVMARVNRLVHAATGGDRFITTFYGLIDPEQKRMLYISAGHNPALLMRADGSAELLHSGGLPLGVFDNSRYSESVVDFKSGDVLVIYTDGVTEALNSKGESFGLERLERLVRENRPRRAYEISQAITLAVREFSLDIGGPEDDLTVSVIKVK